ncbi:hypothetical protein Tco_0810309 [Tanacetum coccineum]
MLYCVVAEEQYNLAYFAFQKNPNVLEILNQQILPYWHVSISFLFARHGNVSSSLNNDIYDIVDESCVFSYLNKLDEPRSDPGIASCHSVSHSCLHHQGHVISQHDVDEDD